MKNNSNCSNLILPNTHTDCGFWINGKGFITGIDYQKEILKKASNKILKNLIINRFSKNPFK